MKGISEEEYRLIKQIKKRKKDGVIKKRKDKIEKLKKEMDGKKVYTKRGVVQFTDEYEPVKDHDRVAPAFFISLVISFSVFIYIAYIFDFSLSIFTLSLICLIFGSFAPVELLCRYTYFLAKCDEEEEEE